MDLSSLKSYLVCSETTLGQLIEIAQVPYPYSTPGNIYWRPVDSSDTATRVVNIHTSRGNVSQTYFCCNPSQVLLYSLRKGEHREVIMSNTKANVLS